MQVQLEAARAERESARVRQMEAEMALRSALADRVSNTSRRSQRAVAGRELSRIAEAAPSMGALQRSEQRRAVPDVVIEDAVRMEDPAREQVVVMTEGALRQVVANFAQEADRLHQSAMGQQAQQLESVANELAERQADRLRREAWEMAEDAVAFGRNAEAQAMGAQFAHAEGVAVLTHQHLVILAVQQVEQVANQRAAQQAAWVLREAGQDQALLMQRAEHSAFDMGVREAEAAIRQQAMAAESSAHLNELRAARGAAQMPSAEMRMREGLREAEAMLAIRESENSEHQDAVLAEVAARERALQSEHAALMWHHQEQQAETMRERAGLQQLVQEAAAAMATPTSRFCDFAPSLRTDCSSRGPVAAGISEGCGTDAAGSFGGTTTGPLAPGCLAWGECAERCAAVTAVATWPWRSGYGTTGCDS